MPYRSKNAERGTINLAAPARAAAFARETASAIGAVESRTEYENRFEIEVPGAKGIRGYVSWTAAARRCARVSTVCNGQELGLRGGGGGGAWRRATTIRRCRATNECHSIAGGLRR